MRVGFFLGGSMRATGCYYYLLNLVEVLRRDYSDQLTPVILAGEDEPEERLAPFEAIPGLEVRRSMALSRSRQMRTILYALLFGCDPAVRRLFRSENLDVVFEAAAFFGWRPGCRILAWIPDFQHRALPLLFTRAGWWRRELGFRAQVLTGRHVVVSSEDAFRLAVCHYLPPSRVSVVRFALPPPGDRDEQRMHETIQRYQLPQRYFFMPNQFWCHKNHLLVVEALAILANQGIWPTVLASGAQKDLRHPTYVQKLFKAVEAAGLNATFRMPGLIPRADIAPLLMGATAMLNPSLFEGWSTSVEEAKSAGVPMLLSDLDVHREQAGREAVYFDRHNPASLADALRTFPDRDEEIQSQRRQRARREAELRVEVFARSFVLAVRRASGQMEAYDAAAEHSLVANSDDEHVVSRSVERRN